MENETDFDKIVTSAVHRPVHLIRCENDRYTWIKSSSRIQTIQNDVMEQQDVIYENDFLKTFTGSKMAKENMDPICISDTPGMGKSMLLTNIAKQLKAETESGLVAFLVPSELVEQARDLRDKNDADLPEALLRVVADNICAHSLGVAYLRKNKNDLTNLLLDGLDEVSDDDIDFVYKMLRVLREVFPDTRIWITTRPHMFLDLEKSMNVLGYNIQPFAEDDQINFLKSFWSRDAEKGHGNISSDNLIQFAHECLTSMKSSLNSDKEHDIAGIPLQCLLIGEVFEEDANTYRLSDNSKLPTVRVKSISELYQKLLKKKYDTFRERYDKKKFSDDDINREHIYYSIMLIFPSFFQKCGGELKHNHDNNKTLTFQDIYNVGIIERKSVLPAPRFIHRTFAEYFVALFLVESFSTSWSTQKSDLLFNFVLDTKSVSMKLNTYRMTTREFKHNVICYFIDSHLVQLGKLRDRIFKKKTNIEKLKRACDACAYGCFENIFAKLLYAESTESKYNIYSESFLVVCTSWAGVKMTSMVYQKYKELSRKLITEIRDKKYTLLHFAVIRGNYSVVEYLIKAERFHEKISALHDDFSNLVHECVHESKDQSGKIVSDKIQILKYLANINQDLVAKRNEKGDIPLTSSSVHVDTAKELMCSDKNFYEVTVILKYLLNSLKTYSSEEYHIILEHILKEKGASYFVDLWWKDVHGSKFIRQFFKFMEPEKRTLELLKSSGVKIPTEWDEEHSVMEVAVRNRRRPCLQWLLENVDYNFDELQKSFIQSVRSANVEAVTLFIEREKDDTDSENLFLVLFAKGKKYNVKQKEVAQVLIQNGHIPYEKRPEIVKLIKRLTTASTDGLDTWGLWNLFLSEIETTTTDIHFTKAVFMLHKFKDLSEELSKETLVDMLNTCVTKVKNIQQANARGETLLNLAWRVPGRPLLDICKTIIDFGGDPFAVHNRHNTPILKLIEYYPRNTHEVSAAITYLINKLKISEINRIIELLFYSVRYGKLDLIKLVCEWYKKTVNKPISSLIFTFKGTDVTVLDMALSRYQGDAFEYLVREHDCKEVLVPFRNTWIHACVSGDFYEASLKFITLVHSLFPHAVNAQDKEGLVPLSVVKKSTEFVNHLVSLGANVNAVDAQDNTPLHWALKRAANQSVIEALVECGANVNAVTTNNETPLMCSFNLYREHFPSVFKFLLDNNADPGVQDSKGNTVLHRLPKKVYGYDFIVGRLLQKGYAHLFDQKGENGLTPFQVAQREFAAGDPVFDLFMEYNIGTL